MSKPVVIIENWAVVQNITSLDFQELRPGKRLAGNVFGHANLANASFVYTSPIVSVDQREGMVETCNTVYELGEPSSEYKTWEYKRRAAAAA